MQEQKPENTMRFTEFRLKLNLMEKAGEFVEPIGPLVYCIQERHVHELRHQVQRHNLATMPRELEVFSRPDLLSPTDFKFFLDSLEPAQFWQLLNGLAFKSVDWLDKEGAWLQPSPVGVGDPLFLTQFIRDYVRHLDTKNVRQDHVENGFRTAKMFNLVNVLFGPEEAKTIYKGLEGALPPDKVKASQFGTEIILLNRLPMAVDATEGEQAQFGFKMYPGNDDPTVKAWLQQYDLFKSIDRQTVDDLPSRILNRLNHYIDALPRERKGYHVPAIRQVMDKALHECAEQVISTLSQKSSLALQCFGVPTQKASYEGIPRAMIQFLYSVQSSAIKPDVQKRLFGQVFITLLNGRHDKTESKSVKSVMSVVKDLIDWEYCVSKLNTKGRAQLIKEFDDSSYFNKFLKTKDLGNSFSKDLGL